MGKKVTKAPEETPALPRSRKEKPFCEATLHRAQGCECCRVAVLLLSHGGLRAHLSCVFSSQPAQLILANWSKVSPCRTHPVRSSHCGVWFQYIQDLVHVISSPPTKDTRNGSRDDVDAVAAEEMMFHKHHGDLSFHR